MTAGQRLGLAPRAAGAAHAPLTGRWGTTAADRADGLALSGGETASVTRRESIVILFQDGGEFHPHRLLRSTRRVFTKRLMISRDAATVVGVSCA